MNEIDLGPLGNAIARFREAVEAFQRGPENSLYRDACIQRFEFTYELSRSTLLRFLEATSTKLKGPEAPTMATLVRTANQDGLLRGSWEQWREYREMRNLTSHAYDETKARSIAAALPDFLDEVEFLYRKMQQREEGL